MSGPFDVFRKNQKVWMVCLGVLCIIAFTMGDVISMLGDNGSPNRNPDNTLIATSKYGDFRKADIDRLYTQRRLARDFLTMAELTVLNARNPYFEQQYERFMDQMFPLGDRQLVIANLLARRGTEMGLRVSDDMVLDFIRMRTNDQLTSENYSEILNRFSGRREGRVGEPQVIESLRNEILIAQTRDVLLGASIPGVQGASPTMTVFGAMQIKPADTPAERWKYFQRLRRRIEGEAVAVPVADFIAKADAPSESQLLEFFKQHKDKEPVPGSPEPGFKIPQQSSFAYVVADHAKFRAAANVTEEQIQRHYDENKALRYLSTKWGSEFGLDTRPADDAIAPTDVAAPEVAPNADTPAEPVKPETTDPAAATPAPPTPAETPAPAEAPEKQPEATEGASLGLRDGLKLAAATGPVSALTFLQAPDEPAKDSAATADVPPAETPVVPTPAEAPAADTEPQTAEAPATAEAAPAASNEDPNLTPIGDDLIMKKSIVDFRPLSEVRESIREELERAAASVAIEKALESVREKVAAYASERELWEINKDDPKSEFKEPAPLDLEKLAAEHGLTAAKTPLMSFYEASRFPGLGDSTTVTGQPFVQLAFFSKLGLFRPTMTTSIGGDRYLFWITEEQSARVPEFTEARPDVEHVWKMIHSRDLALKEANRIAEEARKAYEGGLAAVSGDRKPFEFEPFSWLRMSLAGGFNGRSQIGPSEVKGVEDAGPEFLKLATTLSQGDVGVAMNHPQTIAYVVRATETLPGEEVLRVMFAAESPDRYQPAANQELFERMQAFEKQLISDARLKWAVPSEELDTQ